MFFGDRRLWRRRSRSTLGSSWTAIADRRSPPHWSVSAWRWRWRSALVSLRVQTIFFAMVTLAVRLRLQRPRRRNCRRRHRRRGRAVVPGSAAILRPGYPPVRRRRSSGVRDHRPRADAITWSSPSALVLFLAAVAHRQLAVRTRAAGDPRKRVPRRGARLPHRLPSHARDLPLGGRRRRLAGVLDRAVAALHRAGHRAELLRSRSTCSSSW